MATNTKTQYNARKAAMDYYVYAPLGAAKFAVDKAQEVSGKVWHFAQTQQGAVVKSYQDFAVRGEKLAKSIQTSAYTKRAIDQTKVARTQVKAATTSVRKAVSTSAEATRSAAKKIS